MSDALSTDPYKGVRDFYPDELRKRDAVFSHVRKTLASWGYEEYNASPLERSEIYEKKGSEEIIRDQSYTFEDRGGRRVTLRPEMTPTLARMVAAKRRELVFPLRWFSIGNRFRYERPQKGRTREFYQVDVDLIGLPEGEADLEAVSLASSVLRDLGAKDADFVIRMSSRKLLAMACKAAGITDEAALQTYWQLLDKKNKMTPEAFAAARGEGTQDPLAQIESGENADVRRERDRILAVINALKARGISNVEFSPEIVRGFGYYTGMVFEIVDTNPENPRSLFGGGRYDGLVALFGGDPLPAVGFAFGDVTLMDFLETHNLSIKNTGAGLLYLATPEETDIPSAIDFAAKLRACGIDVFTNLTHKILSDQIKDAAKRGIRNFVAYGERERSGGLYELKDLDAHSTRQVSEEELIATLSS